MSRIKRYRQHWCWKFALGSWLVMGSVIGEAVLQTLALSFNCAFAQITPDSTLPNNSRVTTQDNISTIEGGTEAGSNLFHSFQEFSAPTGSEAYFNNAANIQNIISRVTGGSASNIDGIIRANGTANLFLINPSGVIFGKNASLRIGGSFLGSTASSLNFADGTQFSATAPQTAPLLTVSVPIGLQYEGNAADIQNQSRATNSSGELVGLQVQPGRTLALVGGDVSLDGGSLNAQGGRVEIAGVAEPGAVGLFVDGNGLRLSFPDTVARANVYLGNRAEVNVRASGGGSIAINAQNLNLTQGSKLEAGITSGLGLGDTKAGDIEINSTGNVSFNGEGSGAYNQVESNAIGNAGNINVKAVSLSVTNGGEFNTSTTGQGNAGNVNVNASDTVSFVGESPNNISSRVYSRVEKTGVGQGGDIYIKTGSLSVSDGAFLSTTTLGIGDAGNVTIDAGDTVSFVGAGPPSDGFWPSGVYTQVYTGAKGQGGNVNITTGLLFVTNGARLITSTSARGQGNAGNVTIDARDTVSFIGESLNNSSSGAFTRIGDKGVGQAGDIYIKSGSLLVSDGAFLSANTGGQGNAGNVTIDARDTVSFIGAGPLSDDFWPSVAQTQVEPGARGQGGDIYISTGSLKVTGGAFLSARSLGIGDAGNVTINARNKVSFDGVGKNRRFYPYLGSGAYSQLDEKGVGQAGDIYISTGSLEVTGGAYLSAGTLGIGDAGDVIINARDQVSFDGVGTNGISSGAYGQVRLFNTQGQGGNVNITAGSLSVTNGASLSSSTYGQKNAGNVNINVRDLVSFDGVGTNGTSSGASSRVEKDAGGNGGSVNITTGSLSVTNGANLIVSSFGQGNAGDLIINARNTVRLDNQSRIGATTIVGNKGNISLRSQNLVLSRGSNITTNATGKNAIGGNINIDTDFLIAFENSDISANSTNFRGGNVRIKAQGIFGTQFRNVASDRTSDITATGANPELSGSVEINTPDIDPNTGLVNLPTVPVDTQVAQTCTGGSAVAKSSFTITGRGGLPPNPGEALSADAVQVDLVTLNPEVGNTPAVSTNPMNSTPDRIVEATGWVIAANGDVILTSAPTLTPHSSWQRTADCRVFNQHQGG
ncbi:S-layer family protein [Nostoc sp. XA010]|uniref:two-partner secretion domain-containing protein n=1 Tax=Nostoc sp. XA010 TaxID=2780407 RepID=UPI001E4513FF|nr:S-layer family protein [Nostoc sp. XA010]MCC5660818.1 S-layer family protein [Nostoc sp. XA010]